MAYLSDIEIAQSCKIKPIGEIAEKIGITDEYLEPYGKYKAKIDLSYLKNNKKEGKLSITDYKVIKENKIATRNVTVLLLIQNV